MLIDFEELQDIIAHMVMVGYMEAVRAYNPVQDRVRASEVDRWLKMMCIDKKKFDALVEKRAIRTRRGAAKNSPLYYSKKEIEQALATAKLSNILTRHALED